MNGALYMLLFIAFLVMSLGSICLLILSTLPVGTPLVKFRFFLFSVLLGCVISYLASLAAVFIDPAWIDNGVEETIVFPEHFGFALLMMPVFQLVIVPIIVLGMSFIRRQRQSRKLS